MNNIYKTPARAMAFCGVMAALAATLMCIGTMFPFALYICPIVCLLMVQMVYRLTTRKMAWTWYFAVCLLCVLFCPDKEAAAVFVFLGPYPILREWINKRRLCWLMKFGYFNSAICCMYWLLVRLLGLAALQEELETMGTVMLVSCLIVGNITFFVLDRLLEISDMKWGKGNEK